RRARRREALLGRGDRRQRRRVEALGEVREDLARRREAVREVHPRGIVRGALVVRGEHLRPEVDAEPGRGGGVLVEEDGARERQEARAVRAERVARRREAIGRERRRGRRVALGRAAADERRERG